jgi:hypothetical protein
MSVDKITLRLSQSDVGQIIDALCVRRYCWYSTQKYLEGKEVDCVIEECSNSEEACFITDNYDRIIKCIKSQLHV